MSRAPRASAAAIRRPQICFAYSSWGIGFRKLTEAEWNAAPDRQALFDELCAGKYLAEEFIQSDASLARFHPESLNTPRVITFRRG